MELICPWEAAIYFIYSSNIPILFFYSHIPAIFISLLVGIIVFYRGNKSRTGSVLLLIVTIFSLWGVSDLIIWATNKPNLVLFFWSLQIMFEPLIYLLSFYLVYLFIKNEGLTLKWKVAGIILYSPIILLLSSEYNLVGITVSDCNAIEGFIAQYYTYIIEFLFVLAILFLTFFEYRKISDPVRKKEIAIFSFGVILFLILFSSGNIIGSFTGNWTLAQAGLISMPVFIAFLSYIMVKFKTFNMKIAGTQVLVLGLGFLLLGILFIRRIENVRVVIIFTLVFVAILGYLLVRSVKKEIWQREQLEKLNTDLQFLIKQRESLMHLINHKVKGAFTHSKYIFAGMLDGSFGVMNPELKKIAEKGIESDNGGIMTVDLILNAANLSKGAIKYDMKTFDFKQTVLAVLEAKKERIAEKGLALQTNISNENYNTLGDAFWLKEVVNNVLENSIRYTKEGKITISLKDGGEKILLTVRDTGVGISEEDKKNLFTEGGRGKDSIKVNVDSTGYGLYSAKLILDAHHGRVWAESEGPGKGSTFFVELRAEQVTA